MSRGTVLLKGIAGPSSFTLAIGDGASAASSHHNHRPKATEPISHRLKTSEPNFTLSLFKFDLSQVFVTVMESQRTYKVTWEESQASNYGVLWVKQGRRLRGEAGWLEYPIVWSLRGGLSECPTTLFT